VYSIGFPRATRHVADLVAAFHAVLPQIQQKYRELKDVAYDRR
jgi:hypothetical protein